MTQHPPESADDAAAVAGVASQKLTPGEHGWTEERMRAAKAREIRLDPDGTRHTEAEQTEP